MRKTIVTVLVTLLLLVPASTHAQSAQTEYEAAVHSLIALLLKQIEVLQAELRAVEDGSSRVPRADELMESKFYDGAYDGLYVTRGTTSLVPVGTTKLSSAHNSLWRGFVALAGDAFVIREIREFRVYSSRTSPYDAFTELDPSDGKWILAVNVNGFDMSNAKVWEELNPLLVHEMGHIAVTEIMLEDFTDTFWDEGDLRYADRLKSLSGYSYDAALTRYYETHEEDFVSEYAATSPLEDAVESFSVFVLGTPAFDNGLREQKVDYFSAYPEIRSLRERIQGTP